MLKIFWGWWLFSLHYTSWCRRRRARHALMLRVITPPGYRHFACRSAISHFVYIIFTFFDLASKTMFPRFPPLPPATRSLLSFPLSFSPAFSTLILIIIYIDMPDWLLPKEHDTLIKIIMPAISLPSQAKCRIIISFDLISCVIFERMILSQRLAFELWAALAFSPAHAAQSSP